MAEAISVSKKEMGPALGRKIDLFLIIMECRCDAEGRTMIVFLENLDDLPRYYFLGQLCRCDNAKTN